jgi:hypothetical protein
MAINSKRQDRPSENQVIGLTCETCGQQDIHEIATVMVTDDGTALHLAWSCRCGLGHWTTADPQAVALVRASGVTIRHVDSDDTLLGQPPPRRERQTRKSRLAWLGRLLRRRSEGS